MELQGPVETEEKINNLVEEILAKLPIASRGPDEPAAFPPTQRQEMSWGQISMGGKSPQTNALPKLQILWVLRPYRAPTSTYHVFLNHFSPLPLFSSSKIEFTEEFQYTDEYQGSNSQPVKVLG